MSQEGHLRRLALTQLDRRIKNVRPQAIPPGGWIAAVRKTLGISQAELGRRLGIAQTSAGALEESEARKTITLGKLEDAARALGGQLVYVIIPLDDPSFEALLRKRARTVAERLVRQTDRHMTLEDQRIDALSREAEVCEIAEDIFRRFGRELWEHKEEERGGAPR